MTKVCASSVGFRFVMPTSPPQSVERFCCYRSNEKNIIVRLLKFAGYIHNHEIFSGNIFGLILKNKMAASFSKEFCWPSRVKGIIGRVLKFTGYIHHYKILTGSNFGLILKNKMATTGVFVSDGKCLYLPYYWSQRFWYVKPINL